MISCPDAGRLNKGGSVPEGSVPGGRGGEAGDRERPTLHDEEELMNFLRRDSRFTVDGDDWMSANIRTA